jgi:Immunity protein 8
MSLQPEIRCLQSNNHIDWEDFFQYNSPDPYDDYGWFHLTIGVLGETGGNNFQVCVATPRAVARIKQEGFIPVILVDQFDAATVEQAIRERVTSIRAYSWDQLVDQLRAFMRWEYEGMSGS